MAESSELLAVARSCVCEYEGSRVNNVPEFHAGPKGNSHANTCRMMGDCAASNSALREASCCMGAHCWISASWKVSREVKYERNFSQTALCSPSFSSRVTRARAN